MDQLIPQAAQRNALKKLLNACLVTGIRWLFGVIVITGSGAEDRASIVGNVDVGLLGNLIAEVAKSEDILDNDIRWWAQEAIMKSDMSSRCGPKHRSRLVQQMSAS